MSQLGFIKSTHSSLQTSALVPLTFTHSCAIGQTGCGKTTSYIYPNLNARIEMGHGILVFDYKGKEHKVVKALAAEHNRLGDVVEIGVPWGEHINLIQYMNESDFHNFIHTLIGTEKDPFWSTAGANLASTVWNVIRSYLKVLSLSDDKFYLDLKNFLTRQSLPTTLTAASILNVCSSVKNIAHFEKTAHKIQQELLDYLDKAIASYSDTHTKLQTHKKFTPLINAIFACGETVREKMSALKVYTDNKSAINRSSTLDTIILTISATLPTIANLEMLNNKAFDPVEALNKGQIIVINPQALSQEALAIFTSSLLNELSRRIHKKVTDVSIFIDEAQRVMHKSMDLHTDILREARVDLFLAFQNPSLVINVIGENNYFALMGNLTNTYHYQNQSNYSEEMALKSLSTFEYYHNENPTKHTGEPLFIEKKRLFNTEQCYQKDNGIYELLGLEEYTHSHTIVYDAHLYENNEILIEDTTHQKHIVSVQDMTNLEDIATFIDLSFKVEESFSIFTRDRPKTAEEIKKENSKFEAFQVGVQALIEYRSTSHEYDPDAL